MKVGPIVGVRSWMAESVRELPGDPSYVLDCLAQRLAREGWTVATRTGPLLQASRDGHFLSLTVLGSARGTLVHAEGSHRAVAYFRQAIGSEGLPPRHFSLAGPGRHLRAAVIVGLGLTTAASLLLLSTFCQSRPSSDVTTAMTGPTPTIANLAPALEGLAHTPVPPRATPVVPKPTPALASARASRPSPQPTPSPAAPSVTPAPPEPTPTGGPPQPTPTSPVPTRAAITSTATRVAPRPTVDLQRLADAVPH
jgi:hypothetical protein